MLPIYAKLLWQRKALEAMRALADKVIDTSEFNVHQLKREMEQQFCQAPNSRHMSIFLTSFGYKYGIPHDTDLILDVRFLPNPYFVNELRAKSGLEREVEEYVLKGEETRVYLDRLYSLLEFTLPLYEREGKSALTLALVFLTDKFFGFRLNEKDERVGMDGSLHGENAYGLLNLH